MLMRSKTDSGFTVDEGGSAEPTRNKKIIGMHRKRGSSLPLLCDPGWVV